jgi:cytoskeletal protein RodZ
MEPERHHAGHHETTDASISALVKFGVGLFFLIVVVLAGANWMFNYFRNTQQLGPPASPFEESRTMPPQPRLQVRPAQDLKQLRTTEDERLNSYGWVDQKTGVARIPIDRAMDLLIEKGLPVRAGAPAKPSSQ